MIQDQLKHLVFDTVKTLGEAIKEIHGEELFESVEALRLQMKKVRGAEAQTVQQALEAAYLDLKQVPSKKLRLIAKSFSLMLELINASEAAWRTHRLSTYQTPIVTQKNSIIYVFTSHPTEARSPQYLHLMSQVEGLLIEALKTSFQDIYERLLHLMRIAVRLDIAPHERPEVSDEMDQIFHTVLTEDILNEQIHLFDKGISIGFRTWVGGDKDGHPKVNPKTMCQSFERSRLLLLSFIQQKLALHRDDLNLLQDGEALMAEIQELSKQLSSLKKIKAQDGKLVKSFKTTFEKYLNKAERKNLLSPSLLKIKTLLWLYPALVLPLEIREDSSIIKEALTDRTLTIALMLKYLKEISNGLEAKWYVRGFIISMCMTSEDYLAALKISKRELGAYAIPIIPLFENEKGLINSITILSESFASADIIATHQKKWGNRFEVMVGYSDSSKENGVLPSRLMVEEALFKLEDFLIKQELTPVFFHGSGGSTSRGGGSVEEQLAWWPQSALDIYKVTIQGEMVQRNFSQALIMRSQVGKVLESYNSITPKKIQRPQVVTKFYRNVENLYRELVSDEAFRHLVAQATPYQYLDLLKIGSRPSKRQEPGKFSLRAIPWILCWTQTRLLLPVWWGVGKTWNELNETEKKELRKFYQTSPLMQSYIKNFGFTAARIELGVWNFHLLHSGLDQDQKDFWKKKITEELELSLKFFREISGQDNLTWFRPWLSESIYFRSSMIHPLNVIQKIALEREEHILLRETVTGIACGMLTTG